MALKINIKSNVDQCLEVEEKAKDTILFAWGIKWQQLSTDIITTNRIVNTGRLRGSLTFSTPKENGGSISAVKENTNNDYITDTEPDTLTVGSNVEYAAKQEYTNLKGAFVRPAILNFKAAYKQIAEMILKKGG